MNGAFGPVSSRLSGSTVTIQCDAGYVSPVTMLTCDGTLMWSPDPDAIECTPLTTPTPTTREFKLLAVYHNNFFHYTAPPTNCTAPLSPPQNGSISDHSVPAIPGIEVTFQCDGGLFPEGIMTATCLVTGKWDRNPGKIVCRDKCINYLNTLVYIP